VTKATLRANVQATASSEPKDKMISKAMSVLAEAERNYNSDRIPELYRPDASREAEWHKIASILPPPSPRAPGERSPEELELKRIEKMIEEKFGKNASYRHPQLDEPEVGPRYTASDLERVLSILG